MDEALHALNRFGLGARPGERRALADPRAWLRAQLEPDRAELKQDVPDARELAEALRRVRRAQRSRDRDAAREARGALQRLAAREVTAAFRQRVVTDAPFVERLVAFWSNHLCVSMAGKQPVVALAGLYEREVIRPHVLGGFTDMVLASARHPAMLLYLDNFLSVGPRSRGARFAERRTGRARGLNENYARELMELHTLGVDGGYTQRDVEQMARILTGWTLSGIGRRGRPGEALRFTFRDALHEPGDKTVLGVRYPQAGREEGERAIRALCAHPSTARFVATKLARHFVSDEPTAAAVDRLARVFRNSGGDLREVSSALVDLPEAWDPAHRKFRTPQDWVTAVFRAFHARDVPPQVAPVLRQLRQPLWAPPAPKGYDDVMRVWADPDSLMNRAELARTIARRAIADRRLDPTWLEDVVAPTGDDPLRTFLADESIDPAERVALAVGGPAFQWR